MVLVEYMSYIGIFVSEFVQAILMTLVLFPATNVIYDPDQEFVHFREGKKEGNCFCRSSDARVTCRVNCS